MKKVAMEEIIRKMVKAVWQITQRVTKKGEAARLRVMKAAGKVE